MTLSDVPTQVLQHEFNRRQRSVTRLAKRRERLIGKLTELDNQIRDAGGHVGERGAVGVRKRPANETGLRDALAKLLKGKTMTVTQASVEVQKAGYRTSSPNFRTIVNQCLITSGMFKRVARGQYTAK